MLLLSHSIMGCSLCQSVSFHDNIQTMCAILFGPTIWLHADFFADNYIRLFSIRFQSRTRIPRPWANQTTRFPIDPEVPYVLGTKLGQENKNSTHLQRCWTPRQSEGAWKHSARAIPPPLPYGSRYPATHRARERGTINGTAQRTNQSEQRNHRWG